MRQTKETNHSEGFPVGSLSRRVVLFLRLMEDWGCESCGGVFSLSGFAI